MICTSDQDQDLGEVQDQDQDKCQDQDECKDQDLVLRSESGPQIMIRIWFSIKIRIWTLDQYRGQDIRLGSS